MTRSTFIQSQNVFTLSDHTVPVLDFWFWGCWLRDYERINETHLSVFRIALKESAWETVSLPQVAMLSFTIMHLADAFIQSDLKCIQGRIFFHQYVCSLGFEPTTFCAANTMLYHWATGTLLSTRFFLSRARHFTTFTLHDLTNFYVERVTAHRIKINDRSCFHNRWSL